MAPKKTTVTDQQRRDNFFSLHYLVWFSFNLTAQFCSHHTSIITRCTAALSPWYMNDAARSSRILIVSLWPTSWKNEATLSTVAPNVSTAINALWKILHYCWTSTVQLCMRLVHNQWLACWDDKAMKCWVCEIRHETSASRQQNEPLATQSSQCKTKVLLSQWYGSSNMTKRANKLFTNLQTV